MRKHVRMIKKKTVDCENEEVEDGNENI